MRYLDQNRDEFPDFNFYELNGMRLTCPEQEGYSLNMTETYQKSDIRTLRMFLRGFTFSIYPSWTFLNVDKGEMKGYSS